MSRFAVLRDGHTLWADGVSDHLCLMNTHTGYRLEIPWSVIVDLGFSQRIGPPSVLMVDAPEYDKIPEPIRELSTTDDVVQLDIEDVVHETRQKE